MNRARHLSGLLLNWVYQVAIAIWLGSIFGAGAVAAPAVFKQAKAQGDMQWGAPLYNFAGLAAERIFARLNVVVLVAAVVVLMAGWIYPRLVGLCRTRSRVCTGLAATAFGIQCWLMFGMFDRMVALRLAERMTEFDGMHRLYSTGFQCQAFLLLAVLALTGWMHLDHATAANEAASKQDAEPRRFPASHPA